MTRGKYIRTEEHNRKNSIAHLRENLSEETRKKMRNSHLGKHPSEETLRKKRMYRPTEETLRKLRNPSKETRRKQRESNLGKSKSEETLRKHRMYKPTEETLRKHKMYKPTKETLEKLRMYKPTEETLRKNRLSVISYIKETHGQISPRIGKYEDEIMNGIQTIIDTPIKRNFYVDGYFCDGYCQKLNIVFEIDEEYHFKNNQLLERDIRRQENITKTLNCKFIRIRERDYLQNPKETLQSLQIPITVDKPTQDDGCTTKNTEDTDIISRENNG
jgi:very-short-patch-repair endonuclease